MRRGTLRSLLNKHAQECGSNVQLGFDRAALDIDTLLAEGKVKPDDFSIQAVFEELVGPIQNWRLSPAQHIAEAISSTAFPQITNRIFHRAVLPAYELEVGPLQDLVTEDQATKTIAEEVAGFTPLDGDLEKRDEFMPYLETDFGEKRIRIYMADFGRMITVSREAIFDDRTGGLLNRCRAIGELAGQHRARIIVQTIEMLPRAAFKESATRGFIYKGNTISQADFYNVDHSGIANLDGQVNKNLLTGAPDTTAFTELMELISEFTNENGDPISMSIQDFLAPTKLLPSIWRMTASPEQPDTTHRAWNYWGPSGPGNFSAPKSSPFLSTNYYWYAGNFKRQLLWLWVWKPASASMGASTQMAFQNQIVFQYRFNYYGGVGHTDYKNIIRLGQA